MHIWSPSISSMLFLLFCKGTRNDCNPSNYGLLASCLSYEQLQQEINRQFGFGKIFCCRMKWQFICSPTLQQQETIGKARMKLAEFNWMD